MKNGRKNLGIMALIAASGAVGVLATLFAVVVTRGPAAAPESVDVRQQAVEERITVTGTATSERATVRIRSSGSFVPGGEPIIYIDGVRVNGNREEALQQLSPDQIDRIEVIKGDAAKERYGSEAANGVIEIVTKSKEGS